MTPDHTAEMTSRAAEAVRTLMARDVVPPTVRDVAREMGFRSASAAAVWLDRAVAAGLLCAGPARASRRFYPAPAEKVG